MVGNVFAFVFVLFDVFIGVLSMSKCLFVCMIVCTCVSFYCFSQVFIDKTTVTWQPVSVIVDATSYSINKTLKRNVLCGSVVISYALRVSDMCDDTRELWPLHVHACMHSCLHILYGCVRYKNHLTHELLPYHKVSE